MSHRTFALGLSAVFLLMSYASQSAVAQMMPDIGYQASLSMNSHNVGGTVTVLDADTLLVEDFTYDGGGVDVFFYLGTSDATFSSGLEIGAQLLGSVFDGTQDSFTIDLPAGMTIDGYNAISVWCVAFDVSFGDGTFEAPAPVLVGDVNEDGVVNFMDIPPFIDILISGEFLPRADFNQDGAVNFLDIAPLVAILSA